MHRLTGVWLTVEGSPVLDELKTLAAKGVELVICSTCVDTFGLRDKVRVGVVGGMPDIITAMTQADNAVTLRLNFRLKFPNFQSLSAVLKLTRMLPSQTKATA